MAVDRMNGDCVTVLRQVSLMSALLVSVIGFAGAKNAAKVQVEFDIPASLLHRMSVAHAVAHARETGITNAFDRFELFALSKAGYANAMEIATRPRGEMAFCDDQLSEKERESLWPFEVEAFEKTLEAKMVRDKDGWFRLLRKHASDASNGPIAPVATRKAANPESPGDEELEPSNPTFRWVNGEVEKWATAQMDSKFKRLDEKTFARLGWGKAPPEGPVAWLLDEKVNEYFVISRRSGAWNPRQYTYLLWDGKDRRMVVASFDSFPNRKEAAAMRTYICDVAALHNLAVLAWRHRIDVFDMKPWRIQSMLEMSKKRDVPTAEGNLRVLYAHIPELMQRRANRNGPDGSSTKPSKPGKTAGGDSAIGK